MSSRRIKVDYLARVEGEGKLFVKVKDGEVVDTQFSIFEPPRFFEAFLRGRSFREAPDITARICGICPVAYMMSACHAMESALGITVGGQLRALRRLLYCGEWIESHVLHIIMLHAPDFLGYEDAIRMAADHPEAVQKALRLKKVGNRIIELLGGREIHPINVRVGGFYKLPSKTDIAGLVEDLKWARDAAREMVAWTASLPMPDFERDYEFVALRHPSEYPFNEGRIVSTSGVDIAARGFRDTFVEQHVSHSTALHWMRKDGGAYLAGPLARYNINFDRLPPSVQEASRAAGLGSTCRNPFQSIIVRSAEVLYACEEALRLIGEYEPPDAPAVEAEPRASTGYGCTEAPRGSLYHDYRLADDGTIIEARIVPPTAQNQPTIEQDLREYVQDHLHLDDKRLTWECEQVIRNYDPCISCATHFLDLRIERA
jgi:sulfhydrogenase subunit alpha